MRVNAGDAQGTCTFHMQGTTPDVHVCTTAVCVCAGVTEQDKCISDGNVSIMGQRLIYSNRPSDPDEEMTSSPPIRGVGREQLRLLRLSKGDARNHC